MFRTISIILQTGPSELSILDPEAVNVILANHSKCTRSPWNDMSHPVRSIFETRSISEHEKRRKVWEKALGTKALREYEPRIEIYAQKLEDLLLSLDGQVINASDLIGFYAFDVMGDLTFGQSFDMLVAGDKDSLLLQLEGGQKALGIFGPTPWLFNLMTHLPAVSKEIARFLDWCDQQRRQREHVSNASNSINGL